jgi:hypothetical protein
LKLVVDTNIYCDFAEGLPDAVDAIATYGQSIFIPSVSKKEPTSKTLRIIYNSFLSSLPDI